LKEFFQQWRERVCHGRHRWCSTLSERSARGVPAGPC
jgi:hypothetical protein